MKKTIATVDMEKVFSKVRVSFFPFTEPANEFYGGPIYNYYTHICYPAHFQCLELGLEAQLGLTENDFLMCI